MKAYKLAVRLMLALFVVAVVTLAGCQSTGSGSGSSGACCGGHF